jgi:hypothetical protein
MKAKKASLKLSSEWFRLPRLPVRTGEVGRSYTTTEIHFYIYYFISKGVQSMISRTVNNDAAKTVQNPAESGYGFIPNEREPVKLLRRIGSTTIEVTVHFSNTSKETLEDKLLRMIEREVSDRD